MMSGKKSKLIRKYLFKMSGGQPVPKTIYRKAKEVYRDFNKFEKRQISINSINEIKELENDTTTT